MSGEEKLPTGKVPLSTLNAILSASWSFRRPSTRVGPGVGEDAAIINLGLLDLVMHVDPITEAGELAGWLAVNVAANDVAVTGARPRWAVVAVLVPGGSRPGEALRIVEDAERAARELGIEIVGGHTEASPGISKPIVVASAAGVTCGGCAIPTGGARPGDLVLQVKPAGIEGTAIIATDFRARLEALGLDKSLIERASKLAERVSVVREAVELAEARLPTSMHDPTEGGLIGGLVEMALASGTAITVWEEKIVVAEETREIAGALGIDPLKLISSGTLLATVPPQSREEAESLLEALGVEYSFIGEVRRAHGKPGLQLYKLSGEKVTYESPPVDEIARLWEAEEGGTSPR